MTNKIRTLIVDDSALVRQILTQILRSDPDIEVVGSASDPYIAREKIKKLNPDVLTLDIEMPRMDGITFLKNLMRLRPMPVVMVSSLTEKGAEVTLEALELGAVDFVAKPKDDLKRQLQEYSETIIEKVKMAARAKVRPLETPVESKPQLKEKYSVDAVLGKSKPQKTDADMPPLIAIGASTGGTEAIREVLVNLPADFPGIVITQHIPEAFSGPFALRLDRSCALHVKEAETGDVILPGHAYVAPGSHHLLVVRKNGKYVCELNDGPPVNRHRPSVDVLFRSVAQAAGEHAVGVILTGMGNDGALGMKELWELGAQTIAQDENTSVVWGMPGEAVKGGGVDVIKPLRAIAPYLKSIF